MQQPLQITFRGIEPSPFIEARVRELAARLDRFANRITSCHVTLQSPHRQGQDYDVRIRLGLPGSEIAVHAKEGAYTALRDAFDAVERQLEGRSRRRRQHETA
ncbi:MAG TPA: HPF/RaiA family ribosome-associated protein [Polyangiales bacterium]|nr:HPF/RaiA family ribosome-associated protein [Polyangiales bacterium]